MLDIFSLISPLITTTLPATLDVQLPPSTLPPVTQATEVFSLNPSLYFCSVHCPFCDMEHSHTLDVFLLMRSEDATHQRFMAQCESGSEYWVSLEKWVQEGRVTHECEGFQG